MGLLVDNQITFRAVVVVLVLAAVVDSCYTGDIGGAISGCWCGGSGGGGGVVLAWWLLIIHEWLIW